MIHDDLSKIERRHALDRMQQRGYVPAVIENTIQNAVKTPSYGNSSLYYDPVNNITVIVSDTTGKVVTVKGGGQ